MNIKILKNKQIIENVNLREMHSKNNIFIQQDPIFCFYNSSKYSESIVFQLLQNEKVIAYANLSHFNNGEINILTNTPSTSSHSSITINRQNKIDDKQVIEKLYFEIQNYCISNNIELFTFATNPYEKDISNYNYIIDPDFKFRNFLQIIELDQNKIKNKSKNLKIIYEKLNENNLKEFYEKYCFQFKKKNYDIFSLKSFDFLKRLDSYIYYVYKENELLNSTIIVKSNNILIEYYLSVNFNNKYRANDYLNGYLCEKFKKQNFKFFNFQSSKKINDGTFVYKLKYRPKLKYFFYLTKLFIKREEFISKCHLYVANDNRFIYPNYFRSLKSFNLSYIK